MPPKLKQKRVESQVKCSCGGTLIRQESKYKGATYYWRCESCDGTVQHTQLQTIMARGCTVLPDNTIKGRKVQYVDPTKRHRRPFVKHNLDSKVVLRTPPGTHEQYGAVRDLIENRRCVVVNSAAGTGKTSMLKILVGQAQKFLPQIPCAARVLILAFNKRPVTQLMTELPAWGVASTLHSLGNGSACAYYGLNSFNTRKPEQMVVEILSDEYGNPKNFDNPKERRMLYRGVVPIVSMCMSLALDETVTTNEIIRHAAYYNKQMPPPENSEEFCTMVRHVLKVSRSERGIERYGHSLDGQQWLPVVNDLPVPQYPVVLVDEGQDLSIVRMKLALRCVAPGGLLMVVGDRQQAIYGFTCADTSSLDTFAQLIEQTYGVTPAFHDLTINWRCPSVVIDLVRATLNPKIQAHDGAPRGALHCVQPADFDKVVSIGDLVICRTKSPLVRHAYALVKRRIPAKILGRDIAEDFRKFIERMADDGDGKYCSPNTLVRRMNEWYGEQEAEINSGNYRNPNAMLSEMDDFYYAVLGLLGAKIDEVTNVYRGCDVKSVEDVFLLLDTLFVDEDDDNSRVVLFSTVHKAKGAQCARVFVLGGGELYPHYRAKSEWEITQEMNLLYVAMTRAGDGSNDDGQFLCFVDGVPEVVRPHIAMFSPLNGILNFAMEVREP